MLRLKYEAQLSERGMTAALGISRGDRVVPEPGPSGRAVLAVAGGAERHGAERRLFPGPPTAELGSAGR